MSFQLGVIVSFLFSFYFFVFSFQHSLSCFTHHDTCVACSISSVAETSDRAPGFSWGSGLDLRWFPVAFLANGVFIVTSAGFELITPVL